MSDSKTNPKQTIEVWSMGRDHLDSYDSPEGLIEDYKLIASDFEESLNGSMDAAQFSIGTSTTYYKDLTLLECVNTLKEEIQTLFDTIKPVMIIPDDTVKQIKETITEYGEKYKDHVPLKGTNNDFHICIELEMQTVEDEDSNISIETSIRVLKDYEDFEILEQQEEEEEGIIEEKIFYFDPIENY